MRNTLWFLATLAWLVPAIEASGGDAAEQEATWWSLRPTARPPVPPLDSDWPRTPIDAFVLAKLRDLRLAPSREADRRTLIRRLTYDLHGLPPTPDEVDAFERDAATDAYERLVDRLLASPRYGERWGRHWLDVVHYGESHGYDKDKPRPNAWPYRDYCVRSFNEDKPYSRFVLEQLAGDVLFPDEPDGIVATGFIAAGPWDFVGHVELPETKTDGLIARYNDRDDMVMTTMSTFQSLTVHCARCHDHKFDPITQQDYYRLQAVFAGVDRAERPFDSDAAVHRERRRLAGERAALATRLAELNDAAAHVSSPEIRQLDARITELTRKLTTLAKPAGDGSPTNGYHSAIMAEADAEKWVLVDLGRSLPIDEVRLIPARPTDFRDTPGFGFPLRFRVDASNDADFRARTTLVDRTAADVPSPGDAPFVIDGQRATRFVRVTATRLWKRTDDYVFALGELQVMSGGKNVALGASVSALDSIEAGRWSTAHLVDNYSSRNWLGRTDEAAERERGEQERRLRAELDELQASRKTHVNRLLEPAIRAELEQRTARLAEVNERIAALPAPQSVYAAASDFARQGNFAPAGQPRPIHLLHRGDVKQPGELMPPGGLACVLGRAADFPLADPSDEGSRRAALANWITDPHNPLTWRSIVNRVWQYHFGRGIVDTPNDFGRMGSEPTHPELLDWLAGWFLDNGQSIKKLHWLIVTSSVYRQESGVGSQESGVRSQESGVRIHRSEVGPTTHSRRAGTQKPSPLTLDSDNRYLWHMNRTRLDAESIRDAALYVSGHLDLTMGGPSVQQFFFKDDHSPTYDYTGYDWGSRPTHRRSVYRFIVRSVPDPFMESFDCPDACQLTPKRNTTLTALQALSMLNNPFMLQQAEHLAARVERAAADPAGQMELAFRLALARAPTAEEAQQLAAHAQQHGLTNACRLLLNSNEFMFVD